MLQLVIDDYANGNQIVFCGDMNFPFINWPEGNYIGRGSSKEKEKIQANIFLNFAENNGLYNIIQEPTRNNTVLDLFMVSSVEMFQLQNTIMNKKLSDHNLISISYDFNMKCADIDKRSNFYSRKIYEYEIDTESSQWCQFYDKLCEVSDDTLDSLSYDDLLNYLYEFVDENAEKFLEKIWFS